MPFQKGKQKTGGRKPGAFNRHTLAVAEVMARLKCDPIEGMARLAMDTTNTPELRGRMYSELAQYLHPKRKAIEHSGIGGSPIEINVSATDELRSRIAGILERRRA